MQRMEKNPRKGRPPDPRVTLDQEEVRRLRSNRGLTAVDCASAMKVSPHKLSEMENGYAVTVKLARTLADYYKVPLDHLMSKVKLTIVEEAGPLLEQSLNLYEQLFPEEERDPRRAILDWLEADWRREPDEPLREIWGVWHLGAEVLGMAFITARVDRSWCFGNYFGLSPEARKHQSRFGLPSDRTPADHFGDALFSKVAEIVPSVKGIIFEVEPVDYKVPGPEAGRGSSFFSANHPNLCEAVKLIRWYEIRGAQALLDNKGKPISYYQPAIRGRITKELEVPLLLMVTVFGGSVPEDMAVQEILDFVFLDLFSPAYENRISGYESYIADIRKEIMALAATGCKWGNVLIPQDVRDLALKEGTS